MILLWHLIVVAAIAAPLVMLHWMVLRRPHQETVDAKVAAAVAHYNLQIAMAAAAFRSAREKDYGI